MGSLYYLSYSLGQGLEGAIGERIAWITIMTVTISVTLHGVSSTPLMQWYERNVEGHNALEKHLPSHD